MDSRGDNGVLLREDGRWIIERAIRAVMPDAAVERALGGRTFSGRVFLVAVGKAAWQMANTAWGCLGEKIDAGIVVTKYGHVKGPIPKIICYEGGHPVPDDNSFLGTQAALDLVQGLRAEDTVLFLLSGGGSALFEKPLISRGELQDITDRRLACGADIVEINILRKRLSAVKGGRFAQLCAPAKVFSVVLSDMLGDPLDMIASGPAWPDRSTCEQANAILEKYGLSMSEQARALLNVETPKQLNNVEAVITGSVRELCSAAAGACRQRGYETVFLTDQLNCEAREAGAFLASIARSYAGCGRRMAFVAGGETVVHVTGKGKGGRNQELALSAAAGIQGLDGVMVCSVGSDGTDGPTDAAGGMVDGYTAGLLAEKRISIYRALADNDAYHALEQANGLIKTGPTGTNVNDVAIVLIGAD